MAFLDNSGDIILDAVLTDLGRQRMAQGKFKISKFTLGDPEIDYALYNKSHPSGSAYYDLEIMQTPIFEAHTDCCACHGLTSLNNADLLYLPTLKRNTSTQIGNAVKSSSKTTDVIYVADTDADTTTALLASTELGAYDYFIVSNQKTGQAVVMETGLDTEDISATEANQQSYIDANNLRDSHFIVTYDTRFVKSINGSTTRAKFNNSDNGDGPITLGYSLKRSPNISSGITQANQASARVAGIPNRVFYKSTNQPVDTAVSAIKGPRASACIFGVELQEDLSTAYQKYGTQNTALFGSSKLYDYADFQVNVRGVTTGAEFTQTLRAIQYKSG
jgi:hypothetical protein